MPHWTESWGPACKVCGDNRMVIRKEKGWRSTPIPCHDCGQKTTIEGVTYGKFTDWPDYKANFLRPWEERVYAKPEIGWKDLTEAERKQFDEWRIAFPFESHAMLFRWLEGRRYDPSKDAEFRAEADALLAKGWHLGEPLP